MPRGYPKDGVRRSRKTGLPIVGKSKLATQNVMSLQAAPIFESDEDIEAKISERFAVMDIMSEATALGQNRSLIVSGPAGLGKSYGVTKMLEKAEDKGRTFVVVKGYIRPTGLYKLLYENRFSKCVVVFDDADSIFGDDVSLNLLKAACDSTRERHLSWLTETKMEDEDGERLPRNFEFNGSVIFITNYDFDDMIARGNKLAPHFEAMISRSHYLDLALKSKRDYMVRIKQVVRNGMLDDELNKSEIDELVSFIEENMERLRELSLRMVVKLAGLMRMNNTTWKAMAKVTCMR
jgi:hypothetical protein